MRMLATRLLHPLTLLFVLLVLGTTSCLDSGDETPPSDAMSDAMDTAPGDVPVTCAQEPAMVEDSIEADTTWGPTTHGGCADYQVTGAYQVNAALTLEPGTHVMFDEGAGLQVTGEGASLNAVGTPDQPIVMTGSTSTPGHWEAIVIDTRSPDNALGYVNISYGGRGDSFGFSGNTPASVIVTDSGTLSVFDSEIAQSQEYAIFLREGAVLDAFTDNTLANNLGAPMSLHSNQLGMLEASAEFEDNGEAWIQVEASTTESAQSWPAMDLPFRFTGSHYIDLSNDSDEVILEAGATLLLGEGAGLKIDNGAFNADGAAGNPILIQGAQETPGYWEALVFNSNTPLNRLSHTTLSHGGKADSFGFSGNTPANVVVTDEGQLAVEDSAFTESAGFGLYLREESVLSSFSSNVFAGNEGAPLYLYSHQLGWLDEATDYDGDTVESLNADAFVHVEGSTTQTAQTWRDLDLPYRFFGFHYIEMSSATDTVTLLPGTTLEFADGAGLRVNEGALSAVGDASDLIVFQGAVATPGYWEAIVFDANNPANEIAFADIAHGGKGDSFGFSGSTEAIIVVTDNGQATVRDSVVRDSGDLCFGGSGNLTVSDNTTSGCL